MTTSLAGTVVVIPLQKEDIALRNRRQPDRENYAKQVAFIDPTVLEKIEAAANALDYETNDFIRAILRWAAENAAMMTARGQYLLSQPPPDDE